MPGLKYVGTGSLRASDARKVWNHGEEVESNIVTSPRFRKSVKRVTKILKGHVYHCERGEGIVVVTPVL